MKEYKTKIFIFERKENDDKDSLYKIFEEVQEVIKKKGYKIYTSWDVNNPNILEDQNGSSVTIWINESELHIEDLIKIVSNWTYWIHVNQPLYLEAESILKLMHESIKNHPVLDDDDYDNSLVGIEASYGAWEYDSYEEFVKEEYDDKFKDKKAIYKKYRDYMDSIYYDENEQDIIFVNDYNDADRISKILEGKE